jgi:hypothetical protein
MDNIQIVSKYSAFEGWSIIQNLAVGWMLMEVRAEKLDPTYLKIGPNIGGRPHTSLGRFLE